MSAKFLLAHLDQLVLRAAETALRELHHSTRHALDGLEAIDQALDDPPDAIVLGAELPGLSGIDAARALRALAPTKRIPILFLTMDTSESAAVRQAGLAMVDLLEAPFDLVRFREQAQKLIGSPAVPPVGRATDADRDLAAISDPLTGLYSRHYMLHRFAYEAARAARYGNQIACILIGISEFDELIRAAGQRGTDRVVVGVANILRRRSRVVDLIGRTDSDEFLVLAPHTDQAGAQAMAERMREAIQGNEFHLDKSYIRIKVAAGIAASSGNSLADNLALFARAENALDQARTAPNAPVMLG